jgi:hypothetical protein
MFYMQTPGGWQPTWCIRQRAVPLWVMKLDLDLVRPEVHEDLIKWTDTLVEKFIGFSRTWPLTAR